MKAAIIGLGGIAPMHIKPLQTMGIPITALCDKDPNIVNTLAADLGATPYTDYHTMLDAGGFDVLHICLPHFLHAPVSIAALEKGYHVLTEKPMATTNTDAENMIAAAKASGRTLGVIFQNRYSPGAMLIKETLNSGRLGPITGGWIRVNWHRSGDYYALSDWRGKWDTEGGGVLINQSIHSFDMVNFFVGQPTQVDASIANRAHPTIEVEDMAEGVISYGDVPISFFVNTYHPYDAPASVEIICQNGRAALIGEDATITFDTGEILTAGADTKAQQEFGMKSYWGVSHVKQIQDFYACLQAGKPIAIDGTEALRTQKLIAAIYEAGKTGTVVKL